MAMNTHNENVSTGKHFVNQSVLVGDPSTPTSLVLMFQSFRFTDTLKRVLSNVSDQFKNLFFTRRGSLFDHWVRSSMAMASKIMLFIH